MRSYLLTACFIATTLATFSGSAFGQISLEYAAPLNKASWELSRGALNCRLIHQIPRYGSAEFSQDAENGFEFRVRRDTDTPVAGEVELRLLPPAWVHNGDIEPVGRFSTHEPGLVAHLSKKDALKVMNGLSDGMLASLRYASDSAQVRVDIGMLNFRRAWSRFLSCTDGIPGLTYQSLQHSRFFYDLNSNELGEQAKKRLADIAFYARNNGKVKRIDIQGYADDRGSWAYNRALSRERAEAVKAYLVSKGINASLIHTDGRGAEKGKESDRAHQRRVEVSLHR